MRIVIEGLLHSPVIVPADVSFRAFPLEAKYHEGPFSVVSSALPKLLVLNPCISSFIKKGPCQATSTL